MTVVQSDLPTVGDWVMVCSVEGYGYGRTVTCATVDPSLPTDVVVFVPCVPPESHTMVQIYGISYDFENGTGIGYGLPVGIPV